MLSRGRSTKLELAIRRYRDAYLLNAQEVLDERQERHRVIAFLTDVLGFIPASDIRGESLLKGPADLAVRLNGDPLMLVSIPKRDASATEEQFRRVLRFATSEGVYWVLEMAHASIAFHRVLHDEQNTTRVLFTIDLADPLTISPNAQLLQFLQRDAVARKGLELLWNRTIALDPQNLAALLCSPPVVNYLQRTLRTRSMSNFTEAEVIASVKRVLMEGTGVGNPGNAPSARSKEQPPAKTSARKGRSTRAVSTQILPGTSY